VITLHQTLEDKVTIIRESFQAGSAELMEVSGSFRVDFESGQSVYIYVETYDNSITAHFETKETDPKQRHHQVETLRQLLVREISFADISEFQEVPSNKNRFVYEANIQIDESVIFHETIVYGTDSEAGGESPPPGQEEDIPHAVDKAAGASSDSSRAEKAIEQLETVDAKMLRQSLDMMNLKRSSNVRMVLTRIFRDAVDAEELTRSIQDEALKLNADIDLEDLRIIKTIHTDGFLAPVIELLYEAVFGKDAE